MIELTEQQQWAVDASPEVRLIDPRTQEAYVLVSADLFERMKCLLTDGDDKLPALRQQRLTSP